jgi:hypothetical protein
MVDCVGSKRPAVLSCRKGAERHAHAELARLEGPTLRRT